MLPSRIISGGQTGVDRAALDAAIDLGIPHGGWCPKGRRAEGGRIPDRYLLSEIPSGDYRDRTRRNVAEAHGTLVLSFDASLSTGTLLAWEHAGLLGRPRMGVAMCAPGSPTFEDSKPEHARDVFQRQVDRVRLWIAGSPWAVVLNIAGPRESKCPGIYAAAYAFLMEVFR